jgi:hypothetical protein
MPKPSSARLLLLGLALVAAAASCQRSVVEESSALTSSTALFTFDLTASPNILHAADAVRDTSLIKVVVRDGGSPVKDATVYFAVLNGPAVFSDYSWRVATASNESGIAAATLLGPLLSEYDQSDADVVISVDVETTAPQTFHKEIVVHVLGPAEAGVTLSLTAYPSILTAVPSGRSSAVITAIVRDGILALQSVPVQFTVKSGPGMLSPWTWHVIASTNENGLAAVTLLGPMASEMTADEMDIIVAADIGAANAGLHKEVTVKVQR